MKLMEVEVVGLFGVFNHKVTMKEGSDITILIGENGLGKTAILKIIQAFFNRDFSYYNEIDFDYIRFKFDRNEATVRKHRLNNNVFFIASFNKSDFVLDVITLRSAKAMKRDRMPHLLHGRHLSKELESDDWMGVGEDRYDIDDPEFDRAYGKSYSAAYSKYEDTAFINSQQAWPLTQDLFDENRRAEQESYEKLIDEMSKYDKRLLEKIMQFIKGHLTVGDLVGVWGEEEECFNSINVKFLSTHRVFSGSKRGKSEFSNTVSLCAKQLRAELIKIEKEVSEITSKLDATFPTRLMGLVTEGREHTYKDVEISLAKLGYEREELASLGLIVQGENVEVASNSSQIKSLVVPLYLYIDDTYKKLEPYHSISEDIKLFLAVVNERFKHKKVKVDNRFGLVFISTVDESKMIDFSRLSSGEQHEIVLFFNLVFNSSMNDLILFDEPELSLHVSWQSKFIADFKRVIEGKGVSALIATHSPDIIGKNWDLTCELKGVEG